VAVESAIVVDETSQLTFVTVPQETIRFLRANEAEILRLLDDLNREVRAEAILLIAGLELIAQAGMRSRAQCQELTLLVAQSSQAAAQADVPLGMIRHQCRQTADQLAKFIIQ
jgi:hypothetical protein